MNYINEQKTTQHAYIFTSSKCIYVNPNLLKKYKKKETEIADARFQAPVFEYAA